MALTNTDLRSLHRIFYVLLAGLAAFAVATAFMITVERDEVLYLLGPRQDLYALIAYAIVMIAMARFMDKTRVTSANNLRRLGGAGAYAHYRTTVIVRLALLVGAAFMVLSLALLTRNLSLYWVLVPVVGALWLARPGVGEFGFRYL
ncbi:hypothetical protein [Neolewinella antarctica]|uniref:Uncharacterized protein n=1 Tax=Neolewinella antarctica TaxID=442734 RepID=A0ABX0XF22_9BACT|nr:hypothetical protein [Neolewinella antarctica]NJC27841.1 hypothetical protein [Neolewinella antarctica]